MELWQDDTALNLTVRDDGIGFNAEEARRRVISGAGVGLLGMEERVRLAGGELEIVSQPRRGTQVDVLFPRQGTTGEPGLPVIRHATNGEGKAIV